MGYDRDTYAVAFEYYRNEFINSHFTLIFAVILLVVVAAIVLLAISMRKKIVIIKNEKVQCLMSSMIHPSDTFADVKEKGKGSVLISIIMVILFYISVVLQTLK